MRKTVFILLIPVIGIFAGGCGKSNIFSWAHQSGGDAATSSLQSDALTALQDKDFTKALEYFKKILDKEPDNAEAIYGYSAAKLSEAGLDLGSLIANLIKQQSNAPASLAPALALVSNSQQASNLLPSNIISNLSKIKAAVDDVLPKLTKIPKGSADGKISANNADVNLNIAFCYILRAAIKVQEAGTIEFDTDYKVTANSATSVLANDVAKDIAIAYNRMLQVANTLNVTDSSSISKIKKDVNNLFDDLKAKVGGVTVDINHDYLLD